MQDKTFVVGDALTFADVQIFNEATSVEFFKIDISMYKNLVAFIDHKLTIPEIKALHDNFRESLPKLHKGFGLE